MPRLRATSLIEGPHAKDRNLGGAHHPEGPPCYLTLLAPTSVTSRIVGQDWRVVNSVITTLVK
jgi:hypothetical protein